ncbi:MAG: PilZ domain-containing protein [Deltaproteobacteria bacterium]|nr:PilZ domain-containing protein [Deltaproteobacteria bacterium]
MSESTIVQEQRRSPRMKTNIPVRYRELRDGAESVAVDSITCDVSAHGLRFTTNNLISTTCRLLLELDIPDRIKPIQAVSRVAWVRRTNAGGDYEVGNEFMEITEKDKELIARILKEPPVK